MFDSSLKENWKQRSLKAIKTAAGNLKIETVEMLVCLHIMPPKQTTLNIFDRKTEIHMIYYSYKSKS